MVNKALKNGRKKLRWLKRYGTSDEKEVRRFKYKEMSRNFEPGELCLYTGVVGEVLVTIEKFDMKIGCWSVIPLHRPEQKFYVMTNNLSKVDDIVEIRSED